MNGFVKEECCSCGVLFGVSEVLQRNWKETKRLFYCPNGHSQRYMKSTADYLREQLQEKDGEIARLGREVAALNKPKRKARTRPKKTTV